MRSSSSSSSLSSSRPAALPRQTLSAVAVASLFASINPAFAADGDVITPPTLSAVDVVGRSASGAYYADEAEGAKTTLPLRELPQSVRVMSRQTLDDLGATRLLRGIDVLTLTTRTPQSGIAPEPVNRGPMRCLNLNGAPTAIGDRSTAVSAATAAHPTFHFLLSSNLPSARLDFLREGL